MSWERLLLSKISINKKAKYSTKLKRFSSKKHNFKILYVNLHNIYVAVKEEFVICQTMIQLGIIDLFCGIGGLTHGLKKARIDVNGDWLW